MFNKPNSAVWLIGIGAVAAILLLLRNFFGPEARERRRRRKNYGRVVSKERGPMIKLAVKTDKPKD